MSKYTGYHFECVQNGFLRNTICGDYMLEIYCDKRDSVLLVVVIFAIFCNNIYIQQTTIFTSITQEFQFVVTAKWLDDYRY